jgi:hypothetical protein
MVTWRGDERKARPPVTVLNSVYGCFSNQALGIGDETHILGMSDPRELACKLAPEKLATRALWRRTG